jgi:hypothetical protein
MLYRLAFNITSDGYLHVTAAAKGSPTVSAIHLNDQVFAVAVKTAQTAPFQTLQLLEAARKARIHPGIDICCEAMELNEQQVELLCPQRGKDMTA